MQKFHNPYRLFFFIDLKVSPATFSAKADTLIIAFNRAPVNPKRP